MADHENRQKLTPEERIRQAEAEEIEALRDILRAEARAAAAEATMIENLVEVDKAVGNGVMSLFGQGPLPFEDNPVPVWLGALVRRFGPVVAEKLTEAALNYVKDKLSGTAEKQMGRAEETKQSANKEAVVKGTAASVGGGVGGDIIIQPGAAVGGSAMPPTPNPIGQ